MPENEFLFTLSRMVSYRFMATGGVYDKDLYSKNVNMLVRPENREM